MKKILVCAVALLCMAGAMAEGGVKSTPSLCQLQENSNHIEFKYHGFYGIVNFSYFMNVNNNAEASNLIQADKFSLMGITGIAGFQWRHQSAGGIGFSFLKDANGTFSQIPLFVEYRCHFLRSRFTPYVAVQTGWTIPLGTVNSGDPAGVMDRRGVHDSIDLGHEYIRVNKGGVTFGLEFGGRVAFTRKFALNFYVGYQMLSLREVERGYENVPCQRLPELYHTLKGGIGFCF